MNLFHRRSLVRLLGVCTLFITVFTVLMIDNTAEAQTVTPQYSFNLATGGNAIPFNPNISTTWQRWQGFYNAGLFTGAYAGNITKVYFMRSGATSGTTYSNFGVFIGQSNLTTFPTNQFFTPVTQGLFAQSYTIPAGASGTWFEIQLTTPVYYNPNQTLIIQICSEGVTGGTGFAMMDGAAHTVPNVGRIFGGPGGCNATTPSGFTSSYRANFGFDLSPALPDDAGINGLVSPVNFCSGTYDIKVNLRNYGTNTLNNVTINWSFDGVLQTPIAYNTPMPTLSEVEITLGSRTFASGVTYPLVVWTTQPNGVNDSFNPNDTLRRNLKAAMSGTFTIGGASPDYPSFAAAIGDMVTNGICGPVVLNVRNGNYNANLDLMEVAGASATNTITIQSESGNKADVNVSFAATATTNNFLVRFGGAKFVTIRNMTFTATSPSFGRVLEFSGASTDILVENCDLISPITTSTAANNYVINSPSGVLNHRTTIRDCRIVGGSMGAYIWGANTTTYLEDWTFQRCSFENYYYMGFYGYYLERLNFHDNSVVTNSTFSTLYPAYMYYMRALSFERNTILTTTVGNRYGILCGYTQPGVMNRIVNNFVTLLNTGANTMYGLYPLYSNDLLMAHNTVYLNGTSPTASRVVYQIGGSNNRFVNNIFYTAGTGYAMYVGTPTAITEMDYNAYYTTGVNLGYWSANRANLAAWQAASGRDANAVAKPVSFRDFFSGDLHLVAPSDDDNDLVGVLFPEVTDDIDHDPRVRPYRGADEACYLIPNSLTYDFVDESGNPIGFIELPGTVGVRYKVIFPEFDATITMTANFYSVPGNQLMYSQSFQANKAYGQPLEGTSYFNVPDNLPTGYYRIELVFNTKNSCGYYRDYMPYPSSLLLVPRGATPCEVWPGDVNNDGVVNYGDRKDLNTYIHDANLRPTWLTGPARYRADAVENPLTYIQWTPQASAPWFTPEGCYMDADGNGIVNNFDYIAIKLNWMRTHGGTMPRSGDSFMPTTFDMSQNYPNPFNPTTSIQYSVPEPSRVHLRIVDMLGRVVATAVDGIVDAGVHLYTFDASALPSGQYLAIVNMVGEESGLSFSKTIKMALNK
jgi:hypothetical protein